MNKFLTQFKKKIKVLHIFAELNYSGGELMISNAKQLYDRHNIETHILSTGDKRGNFAKIFSSIGCFVYHIPFKRNIFFLIKFLNFLKKNKNFDIIHIHTERADVFYSFIIRLVYGYKIGIVRSVNHLFRFQGFLRLRKIIERNISKFFLKTTFICNCVSGQFVEKKYYFMKNKIIPCWYNSNLYSPRSKKIYNQSRKKFSIKKKTCVFISLGKYSYYKNYDCIIDSLSLIDKKFKISYLHLGDNSNKLKNYIKQKKLSNRATSLGVVPNIYNYLAAADVFIMPSSEEGFGVAAIEAMGVGLPSILSNVVALSDFKSKIKGITFVKPNPKSIAKSMIKYCNLSSNKRFNIGNKLSRQSKIHYGLNNGPKKYMKLYFDLLKAK